VDLAVVLTTFVVIFLGELPDKSMFASLVLGTRFRPLPVFCGVAGAFAVHVVIAVAIGGVFSLLPQRLVLFVVAALFAGGSALLLLGREDEGEAAEASRAVPSRSPVRVALASFGVVFLGEWGDITQITTANLTARYGDPVSVGTGALLALWSVAALALTVGRGLVQRVPARLVRRITGVLLAVLAVLSLVEAVRG
jgi:Ca2+/H+ antiporter, TMEM165/GDT1 family